jgi:hypothetical protein
VEQRKFDLLLDGLRDEATFEQRGFSFRFLDSEVFEFDGKEFIGGNLIKYDPDDQEEVINETTRKLHIEFVPNKVIGKSRFILDPKSSILMFTEVPRAISAGLFIVAFSKLFEMNHDHFFTTFHVSTIKERYSFMERVRQFKLIKLVSMTLFPSNPNFDERWESIDERLRQHEITRYREIQENKSSNGSVKIDEETSNKFLMSEDGYGSSRVSGIDGNGRYKTISTKDVDKSIFEEIPTDLNSFTQILEKGYDTLQEIIERTLK